jgi:hypothetical protein
MGRGDRRKCKCCLKLFRPDPRNRRHQHLKFMQPHANGCGDCARPAVRRRSSAERQYLALGGTQGSDPGADRGTAGRHLCGNACRGKLKPVAARCGGSSRVILITRKKKGLHSSAQTWHRRAANGSASKACLTPPVRQPTARRRQDPLTAVAALTNTPAEVVAVDGKTSRRPYDKSGSNPHRLRLHGAATHARFAAHYGPNCQDQRESPAIERVSKMRAGQRSCEDEHDTIS